MWQKKGPWDRFCMNTRRFDNSYNGFICQIPETIDVCNSSISEYWPLKKSLHLAWPISDLE